MKGNGDGYLTEFRRTSDVDLSDGIGGWIREKLDAKAQACGQAHRHALFMPRVLDLCGLSISAPLTVLEIGCANGWAISYRHPQIRYIAVDRGAVYATELRERGVEFHESDAALAPLPVADGMVDLIVLNHLIEHIADSEFLARQLRRVLRPGGGVYIRTPNLARVKWTFWDDYTHVKPFTVAALDHLLSVVGFERGFVHYSDHPRIMLDILTDGLLRKLLFCSLLGGKEIEACYVLRNKV